MKSDTIVKHMNNEREKPKPLWQAPPRHCGTCGRFGTFLYGGGTGCFHSEEDWSADLDEEDIEYHRLHGCDEWKPLCWKPDIPKTQNLFNHSLCQQKSNCLFVKDCD